MKRPKRSGAGARSVHLLDTSTLPWALGGLLLTISDLATWWRQAKAESLGLVTNDAPISAYPIQTIW